MAPDNIEAFKADWEKMMKEFGLRRFFLGLQRAVLSTNFFPLPGQIHKHIPLPEYEQATCSAECKTRHGKGYNDQDMLWLWKKVSAMRTKLDRPLTEAEHQALLDELDKVRGEAPEWRKTA